MPTMTRKQKATTIRAASRTLAALLLAAAWADTARAQSGPTAVYLEPAEKKVVRQSVELIGTAEPQRRTTLSAEVAARVDRVLVDEGDYVKAGSPVCEFRRTTVEIQLRRAQAQLAAAQADLAKMEAGYRPEEIAQAEARAKSAKASLERWQLEYDRTTKLLEKGASTTAEMESVTAQYQQAREAVAEAEANLKLLASGYRREDVEAARAQAAAQQAAADELADTLSKMTVAMPFNGFLVAKRCEAGEWLSPGQPVADVVDLDVVRVVLDVPERYGPGVEQGVGAPLAFESLPGREFTGTVSQIVPLSEAGTHTLKVRVDVANTVSGGRPAIAAGLLARVWLPVGKEHEALLVPKDALIRQDERDLVYTVSDKPPAGEAAKAAPPKTPAEQAQAEAQKAAGVLIAQEAAAYGAPPPPIRYAVAIPVKIVGGYGTMIEVESKDLAAGMPLVTRGTYLMAPGKAVQVRPKEGGGGGAAANPQTGGRP